MGALSIDFLIREPVSLALHNREVKFRYWIHAPNDETVKRQLTASAKQMREMNSPDDWSLVLPEVGHPANRHSERRRNFPSFPLNAAFIFLDDSLTQLTCQIKRRNQYYLIKICMGHLNRLFIAQNDDFVSKSSFTQEFFRVVQRSRSGALHSWEDDVCDRQTSFQIGFF